MNIYDNYEDAPKSSKALATTFGYQDSQDNGVGAWGDNTNNPDIVGVSLPVSELRKHFGDENKAKGKFVEVVNSSTGQMVVAPIVDKGPANWVVNRQGPTIDLTFAANKAIGGNGKTPVTYRILGGNENPYDQFSNPNDPPTPPSVSTTGEPQQVWRSHNGVPDPVDPSTINWTASPVVIDNQDSQYQSQSSGNIYDQYDDPTKNPYDQFEDAPKNFYDNYEDAPQQSSISNAWNSLARGATSEGFYAGVEGASRGLANVFSGIASENGQRAVEGWRSIAGNIADAVNHYADSTASFRSDLREKLPVNEEFAKSLTGQIVQGFGQMAGTLPTYVIPGFGPAMSVGQIYDEGYQDAVAHGLSPEKAHDAAMKYLPASVLDYASDKFILGKILKPLKGKITVGDLAKTVGVTMASEGATEGTQQLWQNVVASKLANYDPNRKLDDGVINSLVVGAIVGGGAAGVGTAGASAISGHLQVSDPNAVPKVSNIQEATQGLAQTTVPVDEISPQQLADAFGEPVQPPQDNADLQYSLPLPNDQQDIAVPKEDTISIAKQVAQGIGQQMSDAAPKIDVVQSSSELNDQYGQDVTKSLSEQKAEAFYDPNSDRVVLIADNFQPAPGESLEQYVTRKVLHEVAGHGGLSRIFNGPLAEEYGQIMAGLLKQLHGQNFGDAWAAKHGYRTLAELAQAYGYSFKTLDGMTRTIEEHLARIAEEPQAPSWFDHVISAITNLLRRAGYNAWTDADTRVLLGKARESVGLPAPTGGKDLLFSKVLDEAASSPAKKRGFIRSVQESEAVLPDVKTRVKGVYEPISNKQTVEAAKTAINEQGIDRAVTSLLSNKAPTAKDYATGIELISRLQAASRFEDAAALVEHMAETATGQGQAIQALSLLSKLTPEGIQMYAQRVIEQAVKKSPELEKLHEETKRLRQELAKSREKLAKKSIIQAKQRGTNRDVQSFLNKLLVDNKKSLWGRYKDGAVKQLAQKLLAKNPEEPAMLQEFTRRLSRQLREKLTVQSPASKQQIHTLSEAEMIGEAIRNFDKYQEVWKGAQDYIKARYKDNEQVLQEIDRYLGQILETPFSQKSVERAVKETLQSLNMSMSDVLAQNAGDKTKTLNLLTQTILEHARVSNEQAESLAKSIESEFSNQQKLTREKMLKAMTQNRAIQIPQSKLQKLIALNNAGALDDTRFFAYLSKHYGIPAWTPELSARVQKLQREHELAKDPEVKLAKAAQMFDAVHELIPVDAWARVKAVQNIALLLNSKTVIRNIGGNVILFALNVPADAFSSWVLDPSVSLITGERTRRSVDIASRLSGLAKPMEDFWNGKQFAEEQGLPLKASIKEGVKTMLTLAKLSSQGKYDLGQINKGSSQIFTSQTGKMLDNMLSVVLSVTDRAFHQSAFKSSISRQMNLAEARGESLIAPTPEMIEEAMMEAAKAVYQDKNFLSTGLAYATKGLNFLSTAGRTTQYGIGSIISPFVRVSGSLALRSVEWSPVGFIRSAYEVLRVPLGRKEFRQKEFVDAFSRAILGTAAAALGDYLFKLGIITALREEDNDLDAMMQASGLGKFRINLSALKRAMLTGNWWTKQTPEDGDVVMNYDWIQPNAMSLAFGAELSHKQEQSRLSLVQGKTSNIPKWAEDIFAAGLAGAQTLESQPLLTGLSQFMRDVGKDGWFAGVGIAAMSAPGMFVPTFITQVGQLMDNSVRETRAGGHIDQAVNRILSRIPVLSDKYPPKYDVFGEAQQRYQYGGNSFFNVMINPAFLDRVKSSPALQEMSAIYSATGDKGVIAKKAPRKIEMFGQAVDLTNEQISEYQKLAGTLTIGAYTRLAASPQFASAPVGAKAAVMDKVLTEINGAVKLHVLGSNPDLVQRLREQMIQKAQAQRALMQVQ